MTTKAGNDRAYEVASTRTGQGFDLGVDDQSLTFYTTDPDAHVFERFRDELAKQGFDVLGYGPLTAVRALVFSPADAGKAGGIWSRLRADG